MYTVEEIDPSVALFVSRENPFAVVYANAFCGHVLTYSLRQIQKSEFLVRVTSTSQHNNTFASHPIAIQLRRAFLLFLDPAIVGDIDHALLLRGFSPF